MYTERDYEIFHKHRAMSFLHSEKVLIENDNNPTIISYTLETNYIYIYTTRYIYNKKIQFISFAFTLAIAVGSVYMLSWQTTVELKKMLKS